jgi:hypothetical protein
MNNRLIHSNCLNRSSLNSRSNGPNTRLEHILKSLTSYWTRTTSYSTKSWTRTNCSTRMTSCSTNCLTRTTSYWRKNNLNLNSFLHSTFV